MSCASGTLVARPREPPFLQQDDSLRIRLSASLARPRIQFLVERGGSRCGRLEALWENLTSFACAERTTHEDFLRDFVLASFADPLPPGLGG